MLRLGEKRVGGSWPTNASALAGEGLRREPWRRWPAMNALDSQEWMGHADIQTTMKYLHYQSRKDTRS